MQSVSKWRQQTTNKQENERGAEIERIAEQETEEQDTLVLTLSAPAMQATLSA